MGLIETPRLRGTTVTLSPLSVAHAPALAAAAAELAGGVPATIQHDDLPGDAARYIELALADRDAGHRLPFVIEWHDRVVGSTSYLDVQRWRWPAGSPHQRTDRPDWKT